MVIGSRYIKGEESDFQSTTMRRFGSRLISNTIKRHCKQRITDPTSGFRATNKRTIEVFAKEYPVDYPEPESTALILAQKFKVKEVPVEMHEREAGKSSINPLKSADYMIKVTIAIIINSRHYKKGEL